MCVTHCRHRNIHTDRTCHSSTRKTVAVGDHDTVIACYLPRDASDTAESFSAVPKMQLLHLGNCLTGLWLCERSSASAGEQSVHV